jgi:hypothetical protein
MLQRGEDIKFSKTATTIRHYLLGPPFLTVRGQTTHTHTHTHTHVFHVSATTATQETLSLLGAATAASSVVLSPFLFHGERYDRDSQPSSVLPCLAVGKKGGEAGLARPVNPCLKALLRTATFEPQNDVPRIDTPFFLRNPC